MTLPNNNWKWIYSNVLWVKWCKGAEPDGGPVLDRPSALQRPAGADDGDSSASVHGRKKTGNRSLQQAQTHPAVISTSRTLEGRWTIQNWTAVRFSAPKHQRYLQHLRPRIREARTGPPGPLEVPTREKAEKGEIMEVSEIKAIYEQAVGHRIGGSHMARTRTAPVSGN